MLESMNLSIITKKKIKCYISSYKEYNKEGDIIKRNIIKNEYNGYIQALFDTGLITFVQWDFLFSLMNRVWERHVIHKIIFK